MFANERHQKILARIKAKGAVTTAELIDTFGAEDVALAFGLALVARRLQAEE